MNTAGIKNPPPPVVWSISCSDSSGATGVQSDLKTFNALRVHGCSVITSINAQNTASIDRVILQGPDVIEAQIRALAKDLPANAIKLGMLGQAGIVRTVARYLESVNVPVICDPGIFSASGRRLLDPAAMEAFRHKLLPRVSMVTTSVREAELLSGMAGLSVDQFPEAATRILEYGPGSVLIKGDEDEGQELRQDYWTDGENCIWLTTRSRANPKAQGGVCAFSSAVAARLARHNDVGDALVIARSFVNQGTRNALTLGEGPGPLAYEGFPYHPDDFPVVTLEAGTALHQRSFAAFETHRSPLYPLVEDLARLQRLLDHGIKLVQLRLPAMDSSHLREQIRKAVDACHAAGARLVVQSHWQEALACGADGIHLEQPQLDAADLTRIAREKLMLGISAHTFYEAARAMAANPSYLAIGGIYKSPSSYSNLPPMGLDAFTRLRNMLDLPVAAFGGITAGRAPVVLEAGADALVVVSDLERSEDLATRLATWQRVRPRWEPCAEDDDAS